VAAQTTLEGTPWLATYRFEANNLLLERDGGIRVATPAPAGS
jgi:hypothetical protein